MIYDHRVLNEKEKTTVLILLEHYKNYDRLDIIIELALFNPDEVLTRSYKKKKEEIKTQAIPEELKYCDSDHCEYNGY